MRNLLKIVADYDHRASPSVRRGARLLFRPHLFLFPRPSQIIPLRVPVNVEESSRTTMRRHFPQESETELLPITSHERSVEDWDESRILRPSRDSEEQKTGGKPRHVLAWTRGQRFALSLATVGSLVILCFNLGFLLWAIPRHQLQDNRGTLHEGNCAQIEKLSTGFHLIINIFGTALLSASNYGMQCLCAPTRQDVHKAHQKGSWLDIGVPSFHNLFHVSKRRSCLWICLALSSVPFHLFYNSTVFPITSVHEYTIFFGHDSPAQHDLTAPETYTNITSSSVSKDVWFPTFERLHQKAQNKTLYQLDPLQCINAYGTTYQTTYGSLIVTSDQINQSTYYVVDVESIYAPASDIEHVGPYPWICNLYTINNYYHCSSLLPSMKSNATHNTWNVGYPQQYFSPASDILPFLVNGCLSEKLPQRCKLQYSLPLAILIIIVNIIKTCILYYISASLTGANAPMLTIGDGISAFLRQPDQFTQNNCLLTKTAAVGNKSNISSYESLSILAFNSRPKRWRSGVSVRRWMFALVPWLVAMCVCIGLLLYGLSKIDDKTGIWKAKLGALNDQTLIYGDHWPTSLIPNTLIANIPQLIFSMLYFSFNSVLSSMALSAEWSQYALHRKGLRVSVNPISSQRSSYFLSLPYRYAIPLIVMSTALHWLISQSIFLVGIDAYDVNMIRDPDSDFTTCGYSPVAITCGIAVGAFMLLCLVALGYRKLASGMPIAGSCSLAISAACHPKFNPNATQDQDQQGPLPEQTAEGEELLPLKWGVISCHGPIGHCSFSAEEVEMPEAGQPYQ